MANDFDVAVIGCGPVGMVTAALLGQSGHRVVLLERYDGLFGLPRAATFDDETMRTFQALGIAEGLLPLVHEQETYDWCNAVGEVLIEHSFALDGVNGWAECNQMYQPDLESALREACAATGNVTIRFGETVDAYRQKDEGVEVFAGENSVTASYVVAADGGNSFTRNWIGATTVDLGFSEPWLVCDFELTGPVELPMARQICNPLQPAAIIGIGPTHHRFSFMLDDVEAFGAESMPSRVWSRVAEYLTPDNAELVRVATYTFRSILVDTWNSGRIFLAGDAAHQMPPFLGQGMCSGIRDARNLAFKLDRVLSGRADAALLQTYQTERAPHVEAVVRKGIELGRVQTMRDPVAAAARDFRLLAERMSRVSLSKVRLPALVSGFLSRRPSPARGTLMPQGKVAAAGIVARFDDIVGRGLTLILRDDDVLDDHTAAQAAALFDVIVDFGGGAGSLVDSTDTYSAWFDEQGVTAVVVRPDHYVFGTASGPGELTALLIELHEHLTHNEHGDWSSRRMSHPHDSDTIPQLSDRSMT